MLERLDTVIAFATVMLLLSLLVTTLVQMALTLIGLRGWSLYWGVKRLLEQIDPKLAAHQKEIADRLLRHPAVTHSGWRRAVAIRREELVRLLGDLSKDPKYLPDPAFRHWLRKYVPDFLRRLLAWRFPHPAKALLMSDEAKRALKALIDEKVQGATAEEIARVQGVAASLTDLLPSQATAVQNVVDKVLAETNKLSAEASAWFDTVMDRTSERFKLHTRYITVLLSFLLALSFQIDSLDLLRQLSRNTSVRNAVIQLYEPTLGLADTVTQNTALRERLATDTLIDLKKNPSFAAQFANAGDVPEDLDTQDAGADWLAKVLNGNVPKEIGDAYREGYKKRAEALLEKFESTATKSRALLAQTGLRIFPDPLRWPVYRQSWTGRQLLGVLMTGLLLSLGAPFWFNTLRKLSDLRPIVARRVDGEPLKGAPKKES